MILILGALHLNLQKQAFPSIKMYAHETLTRFFDALVKMLKNLLVELICCIFSDKVGEGNINATSVFHSALC